MRSSSSATHPLPNPADYGPKGDLSLGTDLLVQFGALCDRILKRKRRKSGSLAKLVLCRHLAEAFANDHRKDVAQIGRAVLIGLEGQRAEAGRLYRAAYKSNRQIIRSRAANLAKSDKLLRDFDEEQRIANEILAERPGLSMSSLAAAIARRVGRKPETVRAHLKVIQFANRQK